MQTYRIYFAMLAYFIIGCSDNTDGYQEAIVEFPNEDATYSLLFQANGLLSLIKLNANAEGIFPDPGISEFESSTLPSVTYRNGNEISLFHSQTDCSGNISLYIFKNDALKKTVVFDDLRNCDLIVHTLAHYGNIFYIGYEVPGTGAKETLYYARIIDSSPPEPEFFDIELDKKPLQAIYANNRVFVLAEDMEDSYRNYLLVYDTLEEKFVADINLGFEAQKLFKSDDGNIIVSYPELHNFVSSSTMAIVNTTRYEDGKEPGFAQLFRTANRWYLGWRVQHFIFWYRR